MSFITLGKSKVSIFLNSLVLLLILLYAATTLFNHFAPNLKEAAKASVTASYYEIEIPKEWAKDYEKASIEGLLQSFSQSQEYSAAKTEIEQILAQPEMSISLFQDKFMDGSSVGWVVRFEFANTSGNSDHSYEAANLMASKFTAFAQSER